jgi:hypothetical protein
LINERRVAARQTPSNRVAQAKGIPREMECVEAVMIEGARRSVHDDLSAGSDELLCGEKTDHFDRL